MASQPMMLRLARPIGVSARQQLLVRHALSQRRFFADRKDSILSSDPASAPSSSVTRTEVPTGPAGPGVSTSSRAATPATPSGASTIPPTSVPLAPPSPSKVQTAPPSSTVPTSTPPVSTISATPPRPTPPAAPIAGPSPPPAGTPGVTAVAPPPLPPPKKSAFRPIRLVGYLLLLTVLGYGGAVWYALRDDNFHDFFTEYVPFGEDAVLFFEERAFQKRFPNARPQLARSTPPTSASGDQSRVTIPWKSGLSWKVSEEGDKDGIDVSQKGKHMSAVDANPAPSKDPAPKKQELREKVEKKAADVVEKVKDSVSSGNTARSKTPDKVATEPAVDKKAPVASAAAASPSSSPPVPVTPTPATSETGPSRLGTPSTTSDPSPKSDSRPPAIAPVTQISNLSVPNAEEPVVQDLVKILNDLITVVNSDSPDAANKYSAPMNKAKESLTSVASKISTLRDAERKAAEERVAEAHKEFDEGARQLLQRIETAQREDDARYREEFEAERSKLAQSYDERLRTEAERSHELSEQRLKNELTRQATELKRKFTQDIQDLVESERGGRLSKLTDLSTNVDNLSELTSNWNGVIDSNLATQKLQVAVDAVRSALSSSTAAESKPRPFVREMAALKLVADGDGVVDAAIASINPAAYQRGIPSQPQLIDRFRRVSSEVRKASLLPEDAGVASHAASLVLSKVMFKKHGQPQGGDVESILTRTETLLEEGDLDAATREMNGLVGWAKVLSKDWLSDARKVLEVKQALEVIETEARLQCLRVN